MKTALRQMRGAVMPTFIDHTRSMDAILAALPTGSSPQQTGHCWEVMVDPAELVIPPKISLEQALNFGIAKAKEVLG